MVVFACLEWNNGYVTVITVIAKIYPRKKKIASIINVSPPIIFIPIITFPKPTAELLNFHGFHSIHKITNWPVEDENKLKGKILH